MSSFEVSMTYSKSTPNTHVYSNSESGAAITSLYIQKSALTAKPQTINVKVNTDTEKMVVYIVSYTDNTTKVTKAFSTNTGACDFVKTAAEKYPDISLEEVELQ
jgi:hypothetical protein